MSLITDTDYLIHALRLTYLRHSEDPYGARVISLNPNYSSNLHIRAAGLADVDRWPELTMPTSPQVEKQELPPQPSRMQADPPATEQGVWPGATGLKYTQTIMGSRSGGAGMRVSGRRTAKGSPLVIGSLENSRLTRLRSDSEPTPSAPAPPVSVRVTGESPDNDSVIQHARRRSAGGSILAGNSGGIDLSGESAETPLAPVFAPQFARGAEMEARRRLRMRARFPSQTSSTDDRPSRPPLSANGSSANELFSDEDDEDDDDDAEEEDEDEEYNEDGDDVDASGGQMNDDDDFEGDDFLHPTYAHRSIVTSNGSDGISVLSAQSSLSQASGFNPPLQMVGSSRTRNRLSPVAEVRNLEPPHNRDIIAPLRPRRPSRGDTSNSSTALVAPTTSPTIPLSSQTDTAQGSTHRPTHRRPLLQKASTPSFRKKTLPIVTQRPGKSALTAMLASESSTSDNPFTTLYAAIAGRADNTSVKLTIYFPHSTTHKRKPMELKTRKDATVEEVIGYALWAYWEQKCEPALDIGLSENDLQRETRLSATAWCLRIVEDDGEVDEDYPVVNRNSSISTWHKYELAVCEATSSQLQQNRALDSTLTRRPSRMTMAGIRSRSDRSTTTLATQGAPSRLGAAPAVAPSTDGPTPLVHAGFTPAGSSSTAGPPVFLRIRVAETADSIYYSTTINVTMDMYMADVLDVVCKKRRLADAKDWALLTDDMSILIPLDRTVTSLRGTKDLVIVGRSLVGQLGDGKGRLPGRSADPNASIFDKNKHTSELTPGNLDYTTAYKKYAIHRKVPMIVGRHERVLAIDGDYIHIMPSATKALLDSMKTSSYHIKSVKSCAVSKKGGAAIKLIVRRDGGNKRYDFEADTPALAAEIVATIKTLQKAYQMEKSGIQHKSKGRRSRASGGVV